ncbi:metallo proteinase [Aaosphaeria arxii CBS 175.79]|uniref:Neutral protease 2 n=1 Tax=Aaosphaeria arxii CBS 175.79 TaxID=1450172 RepID=A0A6A5XLR1_9PLEO|nr:metallo proteinase [Aaosphaeria arxii CBS 175.79]KAF2013846.1 metallo proteinase [Aaosphaeria arxii CBS 175.79]
MKFFTLTALIALANAASIDLSKRSDGLEVKLESTGNSAVKAKITNTGSESVKILKTGSFLSKVPVEKATIFSGSEKVEFQGVKLRVDITSPIAENDFQIIKAGETIEASWDVAEVHDLSKGGAFDVVVSGNLNTAAVDSTEITGVLSYNSNTVSIDVDGNEAASVRHNFKRSAVQSDCTSSKRTSTVNALSNCASLARAASAAASSNTAKVQEYFKSTSSSTISTLQTVFNRVVSECSSTTSGVSKTYCVDNYGYCSSNVLAYTIPSLSLITNCNLYFSALPALSRTCHAQDQATTTLHEVTHLSQIKGTDDLGYGYAAATRLSTASALNNADSYALFANAIYVGC